MEHAVLNLSEYHLVFHGFLIIPTIEKIVNKNNRELRLCQHNRSWQVESVFLSKPEECEGNARIPEAEYFSNVMLKVSSGLQDTQGVFH